MHRSLLIVLTLTLLASAVMAQLPGANSPKYKQQGSAQQPAAQQQADTAAKKSGTYSRGALSDFMKYASQVVNQQNEELNFAENEIFVISQELIRENDNQLGVKMQFFNCFRKSIKMIDVYFVPYNAMGVEQKDASGLGSMTVRCAGRINPGSKAETKFPNMFWNRDKQIEYLLVAKIIFTFFDESTVTYNGIDEVLKHYK